MYLPKYILENILEHNDITYDSLYVSCDVKFTKRTGTLYKYVKKKEEIEYKNWLHIGDNKKSDYYQPLKLGIEAVLVQYSYDKNNLFKTDKDDAQRDLTAFISNRVKKLELKGYDYYYHIGYEGLGPLLFGFIQWLNKEIEIESIRKVFFLSRDGQIMEAAYKKLNGKKVEHKYMYASRRSLIVPSLFLNPKLENIKKTMFWPRYGTISAFIKKIGLQPQTYTKRLSCLGLLLNKTYVYTDLFGTEKFQSFYNSIIDDVITNSKAEYVALLNYLNAIGFTGKVAVIDIGWHGNMQKALQRIAVHAGLDVDITGYYVGMNPEGAHSNTMKGYIFDYRKNEEAFYKERLFTCIFEMLFSANHGSVVRFINSKETVELKNFEYEEDDPDYKKIKIIQEAALQFINDIVEYSIIDYSVDELYGFDKISQIGIQPSYRDAVSFGKMKALRDEVSKIAEPKRKLYYLFHPYKLLDDVKNAPWRIGFLKRLTGLSLPYYKMYYSLRK